MKKTALGTVLGAALLSLAKSRSHSSGSSIRLKSETRSEAYFEIILYFEYIGEDTDDEFEGFIYDLKTLPNTYQLSPGEKIELKFKNILWDRMQPYSLPGQTKLPFDVKLISLYVPVDQDGDEIAVQDYEEYVNNSGDYDDFISAEEEKAIDFLLDTVENCAKKNYVDFEDISIDLSEQQYVSVAKYIVNADTGEVYNSPQLTSKLRKR